MRPSPSRTHSSSAGRSGRRQVRAQPGPGPAGAQQGPQAAAHLALAQLAAQRGVLDVEQLLAHGGEEVVVADQIGDRPLPAGPDRLGSRAAQIAHGGHRGAEGGHRALDRRSQLGGVLAGDIHREQHPPAPAVEAHEQAATALVARGVDVQRVAPARHGGAQGGRPGAVQGFQSAQETIAERGHGTVAQQDAPPGQLGADFPALAVVVIARQADPDDQVIAKALARRHQLGELRANRDRRGRAARAVLANLAGLDLAGEQRDHAPGLALAGLQGAVATRAAPRLGREIHGQRPRAGRERPGHAVGGSGLLPQQPQPAEPPLPRDPREVEAGEHRRHLGPGDRRRMPLQLARELRRGRSGIADQCQQHLPDDRRVPRGSEGERIAAGLALATQCPAPHRSAQERMHGHVQEGVQFLVRAADGGLAHQALHGGPQGAIAREVDIADGNETVTVEAQRVVGDVEPPIVVVTPQVADLPEVVEGGGAGSIAERGLELRERNRRAGSEEGGEHVGGAPSHNQIVYKNATKLCIQSETKGAPEPQKCRNRHDSGETVPSRAENMVQHVQQQRLQL